MSRLRVRYATIFVFPPAGRSKRPQVTTSPERLTVRRGDEVEWTIANVSGRPGKVSIGWAKDDPMKSGANEPFERRARHTVKTKVRPGLYKYNVLIDGEVVFDPELEIMS